MGLTFGGIQAEHLDQAFDAPRVSDRLDVVV